MSFYWYTLLYIGTQIEFIIVNNQYLIIKDVSLWEILLCLYLFVKNCIK